MQVYARPSASGIPVGYVRDEPEKAIGDYAFFFQNDLKGSKRPNLEWFIGWGFQGYGESKGQNPALRAFVCIENEWTGFPIPIGTYREVYKRNGWHFLYGTRPTGEKAALFNKTADCSKFVTPGFSSAALEWFATGITEAAQIVKQAHKILPKKSI